MPTDYGGAVASRRRVPVEGNQRLCRIPIAYWMMSAPGAGVPFSRFLYWEALPLLILAYSTNSAVRLENE